MLHKKISISGQVNKLTLPARLLFTWMIAHADDEGRLKGDPEYIKATVVPMTKWSFKKIDCYLREIENLDLIDWYTFGNDKFIEFRKWNDYQTIRKDRFIPSTLPSFAHKMASIITTKRLPNDNQMTAQSNISESNPIEVNKSEGNGNDTRPIADKSSFNRIVNPKDFEPTSAGEVAAKEVWADLEPQNPAAFRSYLKAYQRGLPVEVFYQFRSEIKQDSTIRNAGAVFNKKVDNYFAERGGEA